jgi:hypothetical protein
MFGSRKTGFFTTSGGGGGGGSSTNSQDLSETLGYGNQSSTNMLLLDDINAPTSQNSINTNLIQMITDNNGSSIYYRPDLMQIQSIALDSNSIYANTINFNYNDGANSIQFTLPKDSNGNLSFNRDTNLFFPVPNVDGTTGGNGLLALNNTPFIENINLSSSDYTVVAIKNSTYIVSVGNTPALNSIILGADVSEYIKLEFLIQATDDVKFSAGSGYTIYGNSGGFNLRGMLTILRVGTNFFISNLI